MRCSKAWRFLIDPSLGPRVFCRTNHKSGHFPNLSEMEIHYVILVTILSTNFWSKLDAGLNHHFTPLVTIIISSLRENVSKGLITLPPTLASFRTHFLFQRICIIRYKLYRIIQLAAHKLIFNLHSSTIIRLLSVPKMLLDSL